MISKVHSFVLQGIDAHPCEIEADLSPVGLPKTTIVGLPDTAVKESTERVRTALLNSGFRYPNNRVTVNLAPADQRKEGPVYDLPIAVAVLVADGTIDPSADLGLPLEGLLLAGELALDGRVRPIRGAINLALLAQRRGFAGVIVPAANAAEAAAVNSVEVYGVDDLGEVVAALNGNQALTPHPAINVESLVSGTTPAIDFGEVRGQEAAKRALTVAAAGGHNILMLGPAGTGKSMMAKALPGVLPAMTRHEVLEVTRIYSSAGMLNGSGLVLHRPVRSPHHTASGPAIVGGGSVPRPGDVSLAHHGILFLDEMPEFSRDVLETLRQPMEDGEVTIARAAGSVRFPAHFMLVAALNPTPKGDMAHDETSQRAMDRYLARLSGPLIDRIDIHVEVPNVPFKQLTSKASGTGTDTIRRRVLECRRVQYARQGEGATNGHLTGKLLDRHAVLDERCRALLGQSMTEMHLSARAYDKIRRVSRTIADLEGDEKIAADHINEAVQYRMLDRER